MFLVLKLIKTRNDTLHFKKFLKLRNLNILQKRVGLILNQRTAHTLFDVEKKDKDEFKDNSKHFMLVCGNTKDANKFSKKRALI